MRVLARNRWREVWFLPPTGELVELLDEDGYRTGEYMAKRGELIKLKANVAPPTGDATLSPFGTDTNYDLVVVLDSDELGVKEGWRAWFSPDLPEEQEEMDYSNSYIVKRVSPSEHYVAIGLEVARGQ